MLPVSWDPVKVPSQYERESRKSNVGSNLMEFGRVDSTTAYPWIQVERDEDYALISKT